MPSIKPFKGVIYNQKKVKDISLVASPPYDIISEKLQDELYRKSPYNFVKLELNKIMPSDDADNNRYTRAAQLFEIWLRDNVLIRDREDALYIYSQKYKKGNSSKEQIGFIGLMGLDEHRSDKVLPHENTLAAPKADRLNLMRKLKANLSSIFVLYDDKKHEISQILKKTISENKPFIDMNIDGIRNRVWRLTDEPAVRRIEKAMSGKDIFIADGHHRYETSRNYCAEIRNDPAAPEELKKASGYIMVYFVESNERMLTILPAHRVIKDAGQLKKEDTLKRLEKSFYIEKTSGVNSLMKKLAKMSGAHAFGMYLGGGFYILRLKSIKESDMAIKDKPKAWKRLDVAILHLFIIQHLLALKDEDDNVEFIKDPEDAVKFVDERKGKLAFFLNPTKVSQVKEVASLGERMPRKATYFYPKPLSGLVVNKF